MKTKIATIGLGIIIALAVGGCGSASHTQSTQVTDNSSLQIRQSALSVGQHVAGWQIEQVENNNYDYLDKRYHTSSSNPLGWIQGAFYIGLTRWVETVDDQTSLAHIEKMAKDQGYQLMLKRPLHGDDHAIGQTFLWLSEQTDNTAAFKPTQQLFDSILANPPKVSLEMIEEEPPRRGFEGACQDRWCWSDALFMAPRTWLKLSNITGDEKYFNYADKEYWATVDYLYSEKYDLFFRDSRYFEKKSDNGQPVFWSRGNGWVFAGLPLIIDDLPKDHPSRNKYIALFKRFAAALQPIQNPSGYWSPSLLDPNKVTTPETSGTGFITFGLAWGVNNGLLTDPKYKTAALKGWQAIERATQANGKVNWVQQVGKSPDPVAEHETQFYGAGAVLLAASEMTKWKR
ncbi:glycoside hydrolase family 88 protein [Aliiglaciecola sp. 3_MG-2023]|uniref:glycoside hydrolase family 88/105 protein n=1 Tax=Aliiglaciecola sp. 3_MG-2023 TaxID=3062644 RepID=UPI0026E3FC42|nr:glycoside hydrolase family 88 protein [Aliiglaciecola sp. 3_MG-2023]MDO6693305.1 glycoside hydrolase family 88 protein [Aliiglaciecola sp. 3_MG-2023]